MVCSFCPKNVWKNLCLFKKCFRLNCILMRFLLNGYREKDTFYIKIKLITFRIIAMKKERSFWF